MRQISLILVATVSLLSMTSTLQAGEDGWVSLMDGKTFEGWKINENSDSWKIEDGAFTCQGERSHLFYVGDDKPFKNFEFQCQVKTEPNSNGGIYFHTKYQDDGWPKGGFECQVNNTYEKDPKKTASIYAVSNILYDSPAVDNEWFDYKIIVKGNHVQTLINDKVCVDYYEPQGAKPGQDFERVLSSGTFALQAHDPGSKVYFREIKVKRLPE
ncbi:DUF1080 domain-containing protein [Rubinisphaera sp.]|mgnify:FL=1|uniref:3-keto-disaccharide hydrolase n=1 Tax=Rubinisphaera sp. TaxID=2024857 RepID=UPI000C0F6144|nr:DUF1080 domain-containing protein [Rubinisphaera sp.]MBV12325.1 glycosyl hydrolase [Rubinisphaera sp.]HCS54562.1 DUF1080 domain-containing protein [Planctomycetaceae bacterium]